MVRNLFTFLLCIFSFSLFAQVGGIGSYQFLNVPINARTSALGGKYVSIKDDDIASFQQNPATLNKEMSGRLSINYLPFFSDIKATNLAYGYSPDSNKIYGIGLTFFDYGKITETDIDGTIKGDFRVNEYSVGAGYAHTLGNYSLGLNVKLAGANMGPYTSFALLTDIGGLFQHPEKDWTVGLMVKNLGYAFKRFSPGLNTNLPFEVLLGTSYKLENLPFRFILTAHSLQKPNIVYLDPDRNIKKDLEGNEIKQKKNIGDQIFRHFIIGGEFLLSKNLIISASYNAQRRTELKLEDVAKGTGFSIGGTLRVKSLGFAYTRSFYYVTGASNHLTLTIDTYRFLKNKTI
jgi:hypothetical protein